MNKNDGSHVSSILKRGGFPSPTGVNYYELRSFSILSNLETLIAFPSPTGVNYYELVHQLTYDNENEEPGFRPQQGLTIMTSLSAMRIAHS